MLWPGVLDQTISRDPFQKKWYCDSKLEGALHPLSDIQIHNVRLETVWNKIPHPSSKALAAQTSFPQHSLLHFKNLQVFAPFPTNVNPFCHQREVMIQFVLLPWVSLAAEVWHPDGRASILSAIPFFPFLSPHLQNCPSWAFWSTSTKGKFSPSPEGSEQAAARAQQARRDLLATFSATQGSPWKEHSPQLLLPEHLWVGLCDTGEWLSIFKDCNQLHHFQKYCGQQSAPFQVYPQFIKINCSCSQALKCSFCARLMESKSISTLCFSPAFLGASRNTCSSRRTPKLFSARFSHLLRWPLMC